MDCVTHPNFRNVKMWQNVHLRINEICYFTWLFWCLWQEALWCWDTFLVEDSTQRPPLSLQATVVSESSLFSTSISSCLAEFSFTLIYTCLIFTLPGYKLEFSFLILNKILYLLKGKNQAPVFFPVSQTTSISFFFFFWCMIHTKKEQVTNV